MSAITPELALVDPQLAATARALLPDPGRFRPASDLRKPVDMRARPARAPQQIRPTTGRARRATRSALVCVLGAAAIAAGALGLVSIPWNHGAARPPTFDAAPRSQLQARASRRAKAARRYTWPVVPGAEAYQVKLVRGRQPVYEATTRTPAFELPAGLHLVPGRYTWSATPQPNGSPVSPVARPVVEETFEVAPL